MRSLAGWRILWCPAASMSFSVQHNGWCRYTCVCLHERGAGGVPFNPGKKSSSISHTHIHRTTASTSIIGRWRTDMRDLKWLAREDQTTSRRLISKWTFAQFTPVHNHSETTASGNASLHTVKRMDFNEKDSPVEIFHQANKFTRENYSVYFFMNFIPWFLTPNHFTVHRLWRQRRTHLRRDLDALMWAHEYRMHFILETATSTSHRTNVRNKYIYFKA